MSQKDVDDGAADLIRRLNGCRALARDLGFEFLSDMLSAAILEAAMQSVGGNDILAHPGKRLEQLINVKLSMALGQSCENAATGEPPRAKQDNDNGKKS